MCCVCVRARDRQSERASDTRACVTLWYLSGAFRPGLKSTDALDGGGRLRVGEGSAHWAGRPGRNVPDDVECCQGHQRSSYDLGFPVSMVGMPLSPSSHTVNVRFSRLASSNSGVFFVSFRVPLPTATLPHAAVSEQQIFKIALRSCC